MPLPLTVSCLSKIQISFTFLVPAHPDTPGKSAVKCVFVCVCTVSKILSKTDLNTVHCFFKLQKEWIKSTLVEVSHL